MTWAKLDDRFNDHPVLLGLPRTVRLLYVEAIVWCCKHETDGAIPAAAVPRFTDAEDVPACVDQLVDAGLWSETSSGWQVVDFLANQRSAADIAAARERNAARQERWRRHRDGDHEKCDPRYCRNAVTDGVSNGVGNAAPTRPDPSRSQTGTGRGAGARAPLRSPHAPRPQGFTFVMRDEP